jgi:hypothetical protein
MPADPSCPSCRDTSSAVGCPVHASTSYWLGPHTVNSADPAHWCPAVERAERAEAALTEARNHVSTPISFALRLMHQRDASAAARDVAVADAKRLAEALATLHDITHGYGPCVPDCYVEAALAAHEALEAKP